MALGRRGIVDTKTTTTGAVIATHQPAEPTAPKTNQGPATFRA